MIEGTVTRYSSDVLIIGHGIAGVFAALTIKENAPGTDILLVDKASTGWAGKANKGGSCQFSIAPGHTAEEIVEFHVRNTGEYLNDQDAYLEFVRSTPQLLEKLEQWGVVIPRDEQGRIKFSGGVNCEEWAAPWALVGYEADFMVKLTNRAKKAGCRFLDKISVTDLLTKDGRAVGAVGFSLLDGERFIFQAPAVVIANGNQDYRAMNMWAAARGDGIAAAWRAGVDMRHGEFGTFRQIGAVDGATWEMVTSEDNLYNSEGEYISPKYRPWLRTERGREKYTNAMILDSNSAVYAGMYREIAAGKGPIYANQKENQLGKRYFYYSMGPWWDRPKYKRFAAATERIAQECAISAKDGMVPVTAVLVGEQSPIKVDHDMRTSLKGLWAIGDACYNGSGIPGAVPGPPARLRGSGLAFAEWSAMKAGLSIPQYLKDGDIPSGIREEQARQLLDNVFAPLHRRIGVDPMEIVRNIRRLMARVEYTTYMHLDRLQEGLQLVLDEKAKLDKMYARDYHYLAVCNEARSMVTCAEFHFRTSMLRQETRGWFIREDYPRRDDQNWLKAINFRNDGDGGFVIWYEDIPIAEYPYQISEAEEAKCNEQFGL